MAKRFRCRDMGMQCDFEFASENEQEVMAQAQAHARSAHNIQNFDEATMAKMRAAIKDEQAQQ